MTEKCRISETYFQSELIFNIKHTTKKNIKMNWFQGFNTASVVGVIGAIALSLFRSLESANIDTFEFLLQNKSMLLIGGFILIFKIKVALDDHQHFGESHQTMGNGYRLVGFVLACISWIFLIVAAYFFSNPIKSAENLIISLVISTSWIVVHLFEIFMDRRSRKELIIVLMREKWILINMGYILILGIFIGWVKPLKISNDYIWLYCLLGLLLLDFLTSRSHLLMKLFNNQQSSNNSL